MTTGYLVGAYMLNGTRALVLDDLATYDEALSVHKALPRGTDVRELVVRSMDDPDWSNLRSAGSHYEKPAGLARREYRKRELGATVTSLLKGEPRSLYKLAEAVVASLTARGLPRPEQYDVDRAVKSRVTLGRCRKEPWMGGGCNRAYYWPKSEGSLADHRCPTCNRPLSQTTLALQKPFHRFALKEAVDVPA